MSALPTDPELNAGAKARSAFHTKLNILVAGEVTSDCARVFLET
jgi:hypothetical protein